jgi:hypothetical protein
MCRHSIASSHIGPLHQGQPAGMTTATRHDREQAGVSLLADERMQVDSKKGSKAENPCQTVAVCMPAFCTVTAAVDCCLAASRHRGKAFTCIHECETAEFCQNMLSISRNIAQPNG